MYVCDCVCVHAHVDVCEVQCTMRLAVFTVSPRTENFLERQAYFTIAFVLF